MQRLQHRRHAAANGGQAVDLNTFYGYAGRDRPHRTACRRARARRSPTRVCIYDAQTNRFYMVVLTLDHVGLTAATNGNNHLDIAVSDSGEPDGQLDDLQAAGAEQRDARALLTTTAAADFCLGDYPHIGADANGIYLTTNEFAFSGPGFYGAQVYGIGKNAAHGRRSGSVVLFNTLGAGPDGAGFTVWPASVPGTTFATGNGGTEYFLSSRAVFTDDGTSDGILQWTMTQHVVAQHGSPSPALSLTTIAVERVRSAAAGDAAGGQPSAGRMHR